MNTATEILKTLEDKQAKLYWLFEMVKQREITQAEAGYLINYFNL